jgi:DNA-binding transcriptional MerR regulator
MDYTIKHLCSRFGLSRSTLLYYDSIGLLKSSGRSLANYRRYSDKDMKRLEQIHVYRQAGLPLNDIKKILDAPENAITAVLEDRLNGLNEEINRIRRQQQVIAGMLKNNRLLKRLRLINKDTLVSVLSSAGFTEEGMGRLHAELERASPKAHQEFLESLGIDADEIKEIRDYSKKLNVKR